MTVENKEATADLMKGFEKLPDKDKGYVQGLIDGLASKTEREEKTHTHEMVQPKAENA